MSRDFLIVICLTMAVNTGMGLIVPILPNFLLNYGFSTAGLSLPFISLIIGRMISKSFAANIIRVLKNKITLLLSFILYGITFVCYPLLDSSAGFIGLRFFEGIVEGISIICLTDLAIILSKENRGKMMGIFGSSFGIGFILGPMIGGLCYQFGGINAIFYAGGVLGGIAAIASLALPSFDTVPVKNNNGWLHSVVEHSQFFPVYGPSIIRRVVFFSFMIVLPLYATHHLNVDATYVAFFFTASAVISVILMPFTGKLADRIEPEIILSISLVMMALLIAGFGFTTDLYIFTALFLAESLCFAFMLPSGMKVFANAIGEHPSRTVIISAYGGVTEAITLVLAVLIPYLYTMSVQLTWGFIGIVCGIAALPFLRALRAKSKLVTQSPATEWTE